DLEKNYTIESLEIVVETDVLFDDVLIRTNDWQKIISEDILSIEKRSVIIEEMEEYFPIELSNYSFIAFLFLNNGTYKKQGIIFSDERYLLEIPADINKSEINKILIRAISPNVKRKKLSYYQPNLKFGKSAISNYTVERIAFNDMNYPFISLKTDETFMDFDESDFIFKSGNTIITPILTQKDEKGFHFLFNTSESKISITLKKYLKQFFTKNQWEIDYESNDKPVLENMIDDFNQYIDITISPDIVDETTPVCIELQQIQNNKIIIEYSLENSRFNIFERPKRYMTNENKEQFIINEMYPGQEINLKIYYLEDNSKLLLKNEKIEVKKKLIDDIDALLPFEDHYRDMDLQSNLSGLRNVDYSHFLFTLRLSINNGKLNLNEYILDAKIKINGQGIPFYKIKSNIIKNDEFYIYFKKKSIEKDIEDLVISLLFRTVEPYSDFKEDIHLTIKKNDNDIILLTKDDKKLIKDSNMKNIAIDEYHKVHHLLMEGAVKKKPKNTTFKRYGLYNDRTKILDSSKTIFPVWFLGVNYCILE
ncbi:MAG: hypothetical protein ABEK36_01545, partial [Candidatus Aenigmatarchaeota archaeon]